jgi:hypothetical protein
MAPDLAARYIAGAMNCTGKMRGDEPHMRRTFTTLELKSKCYALLRQVEETRKYIVITKDGKPIARVRPHRRPRNKAN